MSTKDQIKHIEAKLESYIGLTVTVQLGERHKAQSVLKRVSQVALKDLKNKPEKRDGKTPICVLLQFDHFRLVFVMEDILEIRESIKQIAFCFSWGIVGLER